MNTFRFSPIENKDELIDAVVYIATNTSKLCEKVIGKSLPIQSLTVFSHYPGEYEKLVQMLFEMGVLINENNGPRVVLHKPIKTNDHIITHLRIRIPDIERPQVGCNDFEVENYEIFKSQYLSNHPDNLRCIVRPEYEMIEFSDPKYDVLAYVVSSK